VPAGARDPAYRAVHTLQKAALGGTVMPTAVGRLTIWSIVTVVAIVVIALLLVNR
jgi:hypothetical protein